MENPYAAGSYVPTDEEVGSTGIDSDFMITASMGKRFGNMFLDNIFVQLLSYGYIFGFQFVIGFFAEAAPAFGEVLAAFYQATLLPMMIGGQYILYYVGFEAVLQRTPAKFLTKTIVVTKEGLQPSFLQILGRSFARLIPFEALSIFFSDDIRTWHDSLSGTKVVQVGDIV